MKHRKRRRQQTFLIVVAILFLALLIGVNFIWPAGFGVFIAVGGTVGALMVLYEVRLTKQIAQAEFIRDLQTSFTSDPEIGALWKKILLEEEITATDRFAMSNYLTFFETLHLLHQRGALDFSLTDDLFRNRFFRAIGHPAILRATILKNPESFKNIRDLVTEWVDHIVTNGKPTPPGYVTYAEATAEQAGYVRVELTVDDLDEVRELQRATLQELGSSPWLRTNDDDMLHLCLDGGGTESGHTLHKVVGWRKDGELVSIAILYDGQTGHESIRRYTTDDPAEMLASVNFKLIITHPAHKRNGLSHSLAFRLEQEARLRRKREIRATIHPDNVPSRRLFETLGYKYMGKTQTSYGERTIYAKALVTR
ncbi:GNAT family N-acetyltransferase [Gordonia malaquae]|uniref:GNAT family N-acetyltransferase n=1 Tax=Gordonia malaquae TaxID=410332 RepID=UPI001CBA61D3|nr:GNAT family N-acetyltransferase [Gordonia malaquae]